MVISSCRRESAIRDHSLFPCAALAMLMALGGTAIAAAPDAEQRYAELGSCPLSSKVVIRSCRIGYRVHGEMNADKSNVVLFPTWYNGQTRDQEALVGAGRMLDSSKYFIITIDSLGNGVSSSPSNAAPPQRALQFPKFTIADMVATDRKMLDAVFGLAHVHAVVGISMGGMQAYEWAVRYPGYVDTVIAIEGTPWPTSNDLLTWHIMRATIVEDRSYEGGRYQQEPVLALANEVDTYMAYSPSYRASATSVQDYARFLEDTDSEPSIGANNRVWQLDAMTEFNLLRGSSISDIAARRLPRMLIVVSRQDHTVNPSPSLEWANRTHTPLVVLEGDCGHMNPICVQEQLANAVQSKLDER